jgi:CheY-like chemotaxis protein
MPTMHALIIEDQFVVATLIEDELRELGYTSIQVVDTQAEAITAAEAKCPDLITADQRLATGTGIEAIRVICAERAIPVVFITAYPEEVRAQLPDAILLAKPFASRTLRLAVGQAVALCQPSPAPAK